MDSINSFKKLRLLLGFSDLIPFAKKCFQIVENEMIIFNEGSIMDKNYVYEIYKDRYEIQKNVTDSNVLGYDYLLSNIVEYSKDKIFVMNIITENLSYIVFTDSEISFLIGILESPYSNIEKILEIEKITLEKGYYSSNIKFFKGEKI